MNTGMVYDGFSSDYAGIELISNQITNIPNVWEFAIEISVYNDEIDFLNIVIYFENVLGETQCLGLPIQLGGECIPDVLPDDCVSEWGRKLMNCTDELENELEFNFEMKFPFQNYQICDFELFGTINHGSVIINSVTEFNDFFLANISILLPKDYDRNLDYELRLYLCDENEELVCYLAPFKLLCDHECAYDTTIQNLSCEKFENGNMIFPFDWSIDLNGYTLCENGLTGYLNNGGIVNVISSEINGTKLDFIINLSMPDNTDLLQDFELRLYLCDEFGNSSCFLIPLSLSCGEEACNIIDENVTINCIREYRGYYIFNYSNLLQLPSNYQLCNGFLQTSIDGNGLIQGQLDS